MGFFFLPSSFISWFKSFSHFCLFVAPWGAFTTHGSLKRFMKVIISDWRRISTYTHTGATNPNTSSRVALIFLRSSLWRVNLWKHIVSCDLFNYSWSSWRTLMLKVSAEKRCRQPIVQVYRSTAQHNNKGSFVFYVRSANKNRCSMFSEHLCIRSSTPGSLRGAV